MKCWGIATCVMHAGNCKVFRRACSSRASERGFSFARRKWETWDRRISVFAD